MGTEDQVVFARVDGDVVDRDRRQIQFELRPVPSLIGRHEQRALGAGKEQFRIAEVLADDVQRAGVVRDSAADRLPRLAVVARHESVDIEVAAAMTVERDVGRAFVVPRRDDAADVSSFRNASHSVRDVFPCFAAVA